MEFIFYSFVGLGGGRGFEVLPAEVLTKISFAWPNEHPLIFARNDARISDELVHGVHAITPASIRILSERVGKMRNGSLLQPPGEPNR